MNTKISEELSEAYEAVISYLFHQMPFSEKDIESVIAEDVMVYGTSVEEHIFGINDFKRVIIMIMQAEQNSVITARVAVRLLRKHPRMTMKLKRGATHFLPMEAPYDVREELSAYISRLVEGFSAAEEGPVRRTLSTWERG